MSLFPLQSAASLLKNTLITSINAATSQQRVPFAFTSTARLIKSGNIKYIPNAGLVVASAEARTRQQLASIEAETRGLQALAQVGLSAFVAGFDTVVAGIDGASGGTQAGPGRAPRISGVSPVIRMAVNPNSVSFSQNKRISRRDTMEGATFYHFTDSADQNNDILEVSMTGDTGNININVDPISLVGTGAYLKLKTWHDLYNLTREGMLLNEANSSIKFASRSIPNQFFITYRTVLFPVQITLVGFFSQPLAFTETAESPYNTKYSIRFTVTDTYPKLDAISSRIGSAVLANTLFDATTAPVSAAGALLNKAVSGGG